MPVEHIFGQRIAGRQHYLDVRPSTPYLKRHYPPVHLRHRQIGEDYIKATAFELEQPLGSACGQLGPVTCRIEHPCERFTHSFVVVYYEYIRGPDLAGCRHASRAPFHLLYGQRDDKGRAPPRKAVGLDTPSMPLYDAVAHRKAEPRSCSAFCCKKRLEYPFANLAAHSDAIVGEGYKHPCFTALR